MKLRELLSAIPGEVTLPDHPAMKQEVTGLKTNSHACQPGDLFIGMPGTRVDGGEFWQSAIASGAIAAVVSPRILIGAQSGDACLIPVEDVTAACAGLAAAFYGYPARKMQLVGVTGTNGKTTTTHLIEYLLAQTGRSPALFGTLYARWAGAQQTASYTTPFAPDLQRQLAAAAAAGATVGVMEVSSHALAQHRVLGCRFAAAVFTNLTQDHLDYHASMEAYFAAKAMLFEEAYLTGRAIINQDDRYGCQLIARLPAERVWRYSLEDPHADLYVSHLDMSPAGVRGILHTPHGEQAFDLPLVGRYNLANMLAAVGAVLHLGLTLEQVVGVLPGFESVPGRMERVQVNAAQDISAIVDYAHTPDSLENLLRAVRPYISGRTICVFGCGGDRDRTKRPLMGEIAARLADWVVVTSDNPRTEEPQRILQDILQGIPSGADCVVICDRAEAIRTAILQANPGDGVVVAGKGHEDYQILGTEKIHFDDREQVRDALMQRLGADPQGIENRYQLSGNTTAVTEY